jgi:hypothetical protein
MIDVFFTKDQNLFNLCKYYQINNFYELIKKIEKKNISITI